MLILLLLISSTVARGSAEASCIIRALNEQIKDSRMQTVFLGTVVDLQSGVTGQVATLEVERLWYGPTSFRVVRYNDNSPSKDTTITLKFGERYVVGAYTLGPRDVVPARALNPDVTLGANRCTIHEPGGKDANRVLGDAVGYPSSR
jgi:hypothetical protein